jgi:hypothetical protein
MPATTSSPCAFARRWVAGERHARAGILALVPEHHLDHVDRGAKVVRDAVRAPVHLRARRVPGVEDRLDRSGELVARVLREVLSRLQVVDALERLDELLQVVGGEIDVLRDAAPLFQVGDRLLKPLRIDPGDDVAVHLDQAPVRVLGEARILSRLREALDSFIVEPEVEDRVHHPRHGDGGSGADRDEHWILRIAETLPGRLLEARHVLGDFLLEAVRHLPPCTHVRDAGRRRDGEARRNWDADRGHLGEADPLAAEKLAPEVRPLGEVENVALVHSGQDYHVSFRRLDGSKAASDTGAMRRRPLNPVLLLVFVACALVGGGFFDEHL